MEDSSTTEDIGSNNKRQLTYTRGETGGIEGNIYQILLCTYFLLKGINSKHCFRMATEMAAGLKFDDIVVQFLDNENQVEASHLIQVKHRVDLTKENNIIAFKQLQKTKLGKKSFDEINSKEREKCLLFFCFLKYKTSAKLWITSRRNFVDQLENGLCVFATEFVPLTAEEQLKFLCDVWSFRTKLLQPNEFQPNSIRDLAQNLLQKLSVVRRGPFSFLGIPLQLRMVAEGFHKEVIKFMNGDQNIIKNLGAISILSLYEGFIDSKFNLYCEEKMKSPDTDLTTPHKEFYTEVHQYFAYKWLSDSLHFKFDIFNDGQIQKFEEREDNLKKVGIVQSEDFEILRKNRKIEKKKFHFIHRTFAEYSLSSLLVKCIKGSPTKYVNTELYNFLKQYYDVIPQFINLMLASECPLHLAVLRRDTVFLCSNISPHPPRDALGRTALHLAAQLSYEECLYALAQHNYTGGEEDQYGATPLLYACMRKTDNVYHGKVDCMKYLLEYFADVDIKNNIFTKPMHADSPLEVGDTIFEGETRNDYAVVKMVNTPDFMGKSPLRTWMDYCDINAAFLLIAYGASVEELSAEYVHARVEVCTESMSSDMLSSPALHLLCTRLQQRGIRDTDLTPVLPYLLAAGHTRLIIQLSGLGYIDLSKLIGYPNDVFREHCFLDDTDLEKVIMCMNDLNADPNYFTMFFEFAVKNHYTISCLYLLEIHHELLISDSLLPQAVSNAQIFKYIWENYVKTPEKSKHTRTLLKAVTPMPLKGLNYTLMLNS